MNVHEYLTASSVKNPYSDPTNPKDLVAQVKLPIDLVPDSLDVIASLSFLEGALKYGRYNWRMKPVKFSVYVSALRRHSAKLNAGEWADPKSRVPHISSIIACAGIIFDAHICGTLIDDRPPSSQKIVDFIDNATGVVQHLQEIFENEMPYQYTIADGTYEDPARPGSSPPAETHDSLPQVPLTKKPGTKKAKKAKKAKKIVKFARLPTKRTYTKTAAYWDNPTKRKSKPKIKTAVAKTKKVKKAK